MIDPFDKATEENSYILKTKNITFFYWNYKFQINQAMNRERYLNLLRFFENFSVTCQFKDSTPIHF